MKNEDIKVLQSFYEQRDLNSLKAFSLPKKRVLNKTNSFKSVLMLSCHKIKHLSKIESLKADAIILNLEDGVAKEDKKYALELCAIFLASIPKSDKKLIVRVNALDEGGLEEIAYLNAFMPDAIRVPKIKDEKDVDNVLAILDKNIELHLSIETSQSWLNLSHLKRDERVTTFYLGILDLFADIKLSQTLINRDNPTMLYMLSHFLVTSKLLGVKAVSFVYQEFKNIDEFSKWLSLEKKMGYGAKGCLSPSQVDIVNDLFRDSDTQILKAKKIVQLFEENKAKGITGFVDEIYGFIDEPIYKGALNFIS